MAVRERLEQHFGGARRRSGGGRQAPDRRFAQGSRRFPPPQPTGPSASLLAHRLVRQNRGTHGPGPNISDATLLGILILHPQIAAERLEMLAEASFSGKGLAELAAALAARLAEIARDFGRRPPRRAGARRAR